MKTISFAVPCYNSAAYMDKCIHSLLACGNDIEILIVNDGSTDDTLEKAHRWQQSHPDIIRVIDKQNGGHGSAVNAGLDQAWGLYFKVVDSDDWLDPPAMSNVMAYLRSQVKIQEPTDLVVGNYVYEKLFEGTHTTIHYRNVFPIERPFTWTEIGRFRLGQYLLMHSVIYRTQLLKDIGLKLPDHCFYVDNIFVYVPLPHVHTLYYLDVDMYRYFIGREGQSINEDVMRSRIDQQLHITKMMIEAVDIEEATTEAKLARYMENYLAMMMCICSTFLRMDESREAETKRSDIWNFLRTRHPPTYVRVRNNILNVVVNLPGHLGRNIGLGAYQLARRMYKFN